MGRLRGLFLALAGLHVIGAQPIRLSAKLPDGKVMNLRADPPKVVLEIQGRWFPDRFVQEGVRDGWDFPKVGYHQLTAEGKRWAVKALFPRDLRGPEFWDHEVHYSRENLAWIGALLAGHLSTADALGVLRESNPELKEPLRLGQRLRIPKVMLDADLQEGWGQP